MDFKPHDSSGTDDDFLPPRQNRISRGGLISVNGRPAPMGSIQYPRMFDEVDMQDKMHHLEQDAYVSVLKAFRAQADAITWEKEGLITELRRELRLSNEEHRDLLVMANKDETIRRIREWREAGGIQPGAHGTYQAVHDLVPSPVSSSQKKLKIAPLLPSQFFGGPSPSFHPQTMPAANRPPSSAIKPGPMTGAKGKILKHMPPGSSSMKFQYSFGPAGRGQCANSISSGSLVNEPAKGSSIGPSIGKKVRTRWPDDNSFYEALITDYNPAMGLHLLAYDVGSLNETWEWVNLSEISPEDIQWEGEGPGISHYGGYGGPGRGLNLHLGRDNGRGRGLTKSQSKMNFPPTQYGVVNKGTDEIQLLQTDILIKEVERIIGASHPESIVVEKAKKVLKEQEQALTDIISRLADLSDGERDEGGGQFFHGKANKE